MKKTYNQNGVEILRMIKKEEGGGWGVNVWSCPSHEVRRIVGPVVDHLPTLRQERFVYKTRREARVGVAIDAPFFQYGGHSIVDKGPVGFRGGQLRVQYVL